jgi:hypothetical protein
VQGVNVPGNSSLGRVRAMGLQQEQQLFLGFNLVGLNQFVNQLSSFFVVHNYCPLILYLSVLDTFNFNALLYFNKAVI